MIRRTLAAGRAIAAALGLALVVAACQPPGPTASPASSATSAASQPPPASADTRPSPREASPAATASVAGVAIDMRLLDLLPADVDGHAIEPSPEAAAESASDPDLAEHADSIAVGVAVDATADSFIVASVVKLKPGVFDEEFYRDWRDSFDEGVCSQAGGVAGNGEAVIDGRTVYIGTCAGGVHTYHVHLDDPDAIVSLNVVGGATFGQEFMENLRD